ncbi:MAG: TIGR04222 domain-containing membrane protein [Armatimonadetes bacterium]|nr:TIGR04222 domain-containing membrane protein [Armatimonadota bacterium]
MQKTTETLRRWEAVRGYVFDDPQSSFPYSAKVAKENGWSRGYALRVIEEYRRFAFLAVAAGHSVSPSEAVDQAWHIHILYTREYNDGFCAGVLGQHLHHGPSRGGRKEDERYQDWYGKTLASYRAFFDEEPPADIWPTSDERAASRHKFQRVDKESYWLVPKPGAWLARTFHDKGALRRAAVGVGLSALAVTPLVIWGCAAQNGAVNPLDYDGPSFLGFYLVSFLVGTVAAAVVRHLYRPPAPDISGTRKLDAAEVAYLNGGPGLMLHSALASLVRGNLVTIDQRAVNRTAEPEPAGLTPIEQQILRSTATSGVWAKTLGDIVKPHTDAVRARLQADGLVMEDEAAYRNLLATWLVALAVPLLGLAKLFVGLSRERPVGILIALLVVSVVILLVAFTRKKLRSRKGDSVLDSLRTSQSGFNKISSHMDANPTDYAMAVALFGIPALAGTAMYDQMRPIRQPGGDNSYGNSGTSCGSSCSSSPGGGDGGGGGDGCGGGGCGGCGGGGGD